MSEIQQHTPGPWRCDGQGTYIWGTSIGGISLELQEHMVAQVRGWGHLQYLGEARAIAVQEANARLIAAAPELLAALEELLWLHRHTGGRGPRSHKAEKLSVALIKKIKGEE